MVILSILRNDFVYKKKINEDCNLLSSSVYYIVFWHVIIGFLFFVFEEGRNIGAFVLLRNQAIGFSIWFGIKHKLFVGHALRDCYSSLRITNFPWFGRLYKMPENVYQIMCAWFIELVSYLACPHQSWVIGVWMNSQQRRSNSLQITFLFKMFDLIRIYITKEWLFQWGCKKSMKFFFYIISLFTLTSPLNRQFFFKFWDIVKELFVMQVRKIECWSNKILLQNFTLFSFNKSYGMPYGIFFPSHWYK